MDTKKLVGIGTGIAVVGGGILLKSLLVIGGSQVAGTVADHANDAKRDDSGAVVKAGRLDAISLHVGDCWKDGETASDEMAEVGEVAVVPCGTAHNAQVVAIPAHRGKFPDADTPGDWCYDELTSWADIHDAEAKEFIAAEPDATISYVVPGEGDWDENGDNLVVCSVESSDEALDYLLPLT